MFPFGRTQKSTKKESTKLVDVDELFKSIDVDGHGYLTLEQAQRALTAKDVAPPSPTRLLAALCSAPTWKEEARAELKAAASTVRVDVSDLSALISYYSRCQKALKDCPELNGELEAAWARVAALELEVDKSHAENAESRARFEQTLEGMEARGQQERVQLKEQLEKLDAQVELNTRERQRERESSKNELEELQMKLEGKSKTLVELVRDSKKQEHELKDRVDELNELKLRFLAVTAPKHEEPVSEEARQLEAEVMARAERESHEGTCTFWFVKAARIKEAPEGTLPSFRTLVQENAFVERTLAASDAYRAAFSDTHLALSHRWETIDAPDTKGKQLEKLQLHLCEHEAIEFVWVECVPTCPGCVCPSSPQLESSKHRPCSLARDIPAACCCAQLLLSATRGAHPRREGIVQMAAKQREPALPRLLSAHARRHDLPLSLLDSDGGVACDEALHLGWPRPRTRTPLPHRVHSQRRAGPRGCQAREPSDTEDYQRGARGPPSTRVSRA